MSDPDLAAGLRNIESELRSLAKATDHVLHEAHTNSAAIYAVESNLHGQLDTLKGEQQEIRARVDSLRETFADFVEQDRRDKQRLFAHAGLLTVRSEIETKYGQYEDVRRNVDGMLLALEGGLALDATMQLIAETQSINAPSYWLAAALNALAAWIRDDRSAAERALLHAGSCSRGRTALFFGLLNARFERFEATNKWFRVYLNDQNPEKLPREFSVVLHAAMLGLLGDTTRERVSRQCQAWFEQVSALENIVEQQVSRWRMEIGLRCEPSSRVALESDCPMLASVSPDWPRMMESYRPATAFVQVKADLSRRLNKPRANQDTWQTRVYGVMHDLQAIYEPGEAGLRRQEAFYEKIIEHEGDKAAAEQARTAEAPLDEPLIDLLTFLSNAASHPPSDAPPETTQLALHLASPWIRQAIDQIATDARSLSVAPITIDVDGWSGRLGVEPVDVLGESFTKMVDGQTREAVTRERRGGPSLVAAALALITFGLTMYEWFANSHFRPWLVCIPAALAVLFSAFAIWRHRRIPQRVRMATERGERRKLDGLATIDASEADRERLIAACNERISEANRLEEFVASIALPEIRLEISGQSLSAGTSLGGTSAEAAVDSPRSPGLGRLPTPFTLPDWSLEPVGINAD
jgi:hypothetical protein